MKAAALIAAAFLQTALALWGLADQMLLRAHGSVVALETTMIDPRDLLRGHYTVIRLSISEIPRESVAAEPALRPGDPVWVTLREGPDGFWTPETLSAQPSGTSIKGTLVYSDATQFSLEFPIERYYAPKTRAEALETLRQESRLGILVALSPEGRAALIGLVIDGQRLPDPMF